MPSSDDPIDPSTNVLYIGQTFRLWQSRVFAKWLSQLKDRHASGRIHNRLRRIADGHWGDVKAVGGGVGEIRFDYGPGYRVYFCRSGGVVVLLLCAGAKSSQRRDVLRAKQIMSEINDGHDPDTL